MAKITHNISNPNDDLGDQLRTAFGNQNTMNTDLYDNKVDKVAGKGLSTNDYSNIEKDRLAGIEDNAEVNVQSDWEQEDDTSKDYIKNKPAQLYTSVGSFHYVDLATITTPLTVLSGVEKKITNDTDSTETNVLNAPYGISSMWDSVNNQLDFTQTEIGDLVTVIPAIEITTTATNQTYQIYIKMGIGSATPTTKQVYNGALAVIGSIIINPTRDFTIDTLDNKDYPAEIYILSSANATVKSGELDIKIVRKDINIVSSDPAKQNQLTAGTNITIDVTDPLNPVISADSDTAKLAIANNLSDLNNTSTARTNLGLGTLATQSGTFSDKQDVLVSGTNIKTINSTSLLGSGDISLATPSLVPLDEGNGVGHVINGRTAANYGNIGLNAVDLSYSNSSSTTKGATGINSFSTSLNNSAGASASIAIGGYSNISNGDNGSVIGGTGNNLTGGSSATIIGSTYSTNSGSGGFMAGTGQSSLNGEKSVVLGGYYNLAKSFSEISVGTCPVDYTAGSTSSFVATDRIFNVGNGTSGSGRSNAFTILKNGLATLPSVTNTLIADESTGKAVVTREYINRTFTVATLPSVSSGVAYATVTDATSPTYLGTLTGGGSITCPVFYNGTAWVSH